MYKIAIAFMAATLPALAHAQTEPARPVVLANETILRVKGEGSVTIKPQMLTMSVGVVTTAPTAAEALDANSRKLAPVIARLRDAGISPSDIQTSDLDVAAQFADSRGRDDDRIIGFRASNRVTVKSRDLDDAGRLITTLFDAGANSIDGPYFSAAPENEDALAREAEAAALREGHAQAEATAQALGMRVSRLLLISDSAVEFRDRSGVIVVTGSRKLATPIEPGEIAVTAIYNMEYALIPN